MTKDEFNEILKESGKHLSTSRDGTFSKEFYVFNRSDVVFGFNGLDFVFSPEDGPEYGKKIVEALVEYANTPIEKRKPKSQPKLYNIIIAKDTDPDGFYLTAWRKGSKLGKYYVNNCVMQKDLMHDDDLKFTAEEVEDLKSKVSEKQKQIIDIGIVKVEDTISVGVDISYD